MATDIGQARSPVVVSAATTRGNRPPSRRQFLKTAGIGAAAVGVGGFGTFSWRAAEQGIFGTGSGPAYAAWSAWDQGAGPIVLVRAAILAANPHNTQPWRFRMSQSAVDFHADRGRNIGAMDPFSREQEIGLGCALENLMTGANAKGYAPVMTLLPGTANLVAHVELGIGARSDVANYQAIPKRHTHRAPFDTSRPVVAETLAALDHAVVDIPGAQVMWITGEVPRRQMGQLIVEGAQAIAADRQQSVDSFRWWRDNWSDVQRYKDGMTLDAAGLSPMLTMLAKVLPPQTREQNDQAWLQQTRDNYVKTAGAFGIVLVPDATSSRQRINGGRLFQRLHLTAVNKGLAIQPLNTPTERIDRERATGISPHFTSAVADLVATPALQALMSFRIGYPTVTPRLSPRRPAESTFVSQR